MSIRTSFGLFISVAVGGSGGAPLGRSPVCETSAARPTGTQRGVKLHRDSNRLRRMNGSFARGLLILLLAAGVFASCRPREATAKGTQLTSWQIEPGPQLRLKGEERDGKVLDVRLSRIGSTGEIHLTIRRKSVAVERDGHTAGEKPFSGRAPAKIEIQTVDGSPWQVTAHCDPITFRDGGVAGSDGVAKPGWFVSCEVIGKLDGVTFGPTLEFGGDDSITPRSFPEEQVMIDGAIVPASGKTVRVR